MEHTFGKPLPTRASDIPLYADDINSRVNNHDQCFPTCYPKKKCKRPKCRLCIFRPPKEKSNIDQIEQTDDDGIQRKDKIDPGPGPPPDSYPLELPDTRALVFEQKRWYSSCDELKRSLEKYKKSLEELTAEQKKVVDERMKNLQKLIDKIENMTPEEKEVEKKYRCVRSRQVNLPWSLYYM